MKRKEKKRKVLFNFINSLIHSFILSFFFVIKYIHITNITFRTWLSDPRGLLWCDIWLNFRMRSTVFCTVEFTQQDSFLFTKGSKKALSFATTGCLGLRWLTIDCFCYKATKRLSLQIFWHNTILDSFS